MVKSKRNQRQKKRSEESLRSSDRHRAKRQARESERTIPLDRDINKLSQISLVLIITITSTIIMAVDLIIIKTGSFFPGKPFLIFQPLIDIDFNNFLLLYLLLIFFLLLF